jgi:hypothetical protein
VHRCRQGKRKGKEKEKRKKVGDICIIWVQIFPIGVQTKEVT